MTEKSKKTIRLSAVPYEGMTTKVRAVVIPTEVIAIDKYGGTAQSADPAITHIKVEKTFYPRVAGLIKRIRKEDVKLPGLLGIEEPGKEPRSAGLLSITITKS